MTSEKDNLESNLGLSTAYIAGVLSCFPGKDTNISTNIDASMREPDASVKVPWKF